MNFFFAQFISLTLSERIRAVVCLRLVWLQNQPALRLYLYQWLIFNLVFFFRIIERVSFSVCRSEHIHECCIKERHWPAPTQPLAAPTWGGGSFLDRTRCRSLKNTQSWGSTHLCSPVSKKKNTVTPQVQFSFSWMWCAEHSQSPQNLFHRLTINR